MISNPQMQFQGLKMESPPLCHIPLDSPPMPSVKTENHVDKNTPEYLAQLLKDRKQIQAFPNVFIHVERLLDEEVNKVRGSLFHFTTNKEPMSLPDANGTIITLSEKLFVPVKEHPDFNFVGRILGPRGMTAKQLEQDTGCKIMVRGKGSMRDKKKVGPSQEEMNRGKPNWEHLNEELHVLITVEDSRNRAEMKLKRAVEEVKKLLVPAPEGEDDLKKRQLMELAIINGTYRDTKAAGGPQQPTAPTVPTAARMPQAMMQAMPMHAAHAHGLRSPGPAGAPLILAGPRFSTMTMPTTTSLTQAGLMNGAPPPLVSPTDAAGFMYSYDPYALAAASAATSPAIFEYPGGLDQSAAGAVSKMRRTAAMGLREHPYGRVSLT